jgi:phthalate 4,5-dioxygenase oxygenase subunit
VVIVPIDDEWSSHWYYYLSPFGPVPESYKAAALLGTDPDDDDFAKDRGNEANHWNRNAHAIRQGHFSGILKNFVYEDFIVEESMGPILDRTQEWLGTSDAVIARARRMLLKALDEHAQGKLPFGLDENIDYRQVRALAIRFPKGTDWKSIDVKNPPSFK